VNNKMQVTINDRISPYRHDGCGALLVAREPIVELDQDDDHVAAGFAVL
jgi:hypothetical protein